MTHETLHTEDEGIIQDAEYARKAFRSKGVHVCTSLTATAIVAQVGLFCRWTVLFEGFLCNPVSPHSSSPFSGRSPVQLCTCNFDDTARGPRQAAPGSSGHLV